MRYKEETKECKRLLRKVGIIPPTFVVITDFSALSYTCGGPEIYIGILSRAAHRVKRSIMHEIFHLITWKYRRPSGSRRLFGTKEEWQRKQDIFKVMHVSRWSKCITPYATTHPNEDWIEMCTAIALEEKIPPRFKAKQEIIKKWFKQIQKKQTSWRK